MVDSADTIAAPPPVAARDRIWRQRVLAELSSCHTRIGDAGDRLSAVTAGTTHPYLLEANLRLGQAGTQLTQVSLWVTGRLPRPTRLAIQVIAVMVIAWPAAIIGVDRMRLSQTWSITVVIAIFIVVAFPIDRLLTQLDRLVASHRIRRVTTTTASGAPRQPSVGQPQDRPLPPRSIGAIKLQLEGVLDTIDTVRIDIRNATEVYLHQRYRASAAALNLVKLRDRDLVLWHLITIDVLLCQTNDTVDLCASQL
jgi:hypothetical protein